MGAAMSRHNSPPPTKRPPPDPIDAARESLDRAVAAAKAFRDADDFDEPTGRFEPPVFQVHNHFDTPHEGIGVDRLSELPKIPKTNSGIVGALATLIAAVLAAAAAKLLGKI